MNAAGESRISISSGNQRGPRRLPPTGGRRGRNAGHRLPTGLPYPILSYAWQHGWAKIRWHAMDLWNPMVHAAAIRLLAVERPEVVHTNVLAGLSLSIWTAAHHIGIPVLHTLHDYYLLCLRSGLMKASGEQCLQRCARCWTVSQWRRRLTRNLGAVDGISQFILEKHCNHGFFRNIPRHVVHNAVAPDDSASEPNLEQPTRSFRSTQGWIGATSGAARFGWTSTCSPRPRASCCESKRRTARSPCDRGCGQRGSIFPPSTRFQPRPSTSRARP